MNTCSSIPLVTVCLCCFAHAASAPPIAIFFDFETEPSLESVSQMKAEVAAILEPSGLSLDWRSLSARSGTETFRDLVVLKFSGSCRVRNPAMDSELGPALDGNALAFTAVSEGRVLPFSHVRCDEIRRFLAPVLAVANLHGRETLYGKALGRVVAHELYHIFADTENHGKEGIARQSHTRRDLTGKAFRFSPKETATLHDVKLRALLAGEGETVGWEGQR